GRWRPARGGVSRAWRAVYGSAGFPASARYPKEEWHASRVLTSPKDTDGLAEVAHGCWLQSVSGSLSGEGRPQSRRNLPRGALASSGRGRRALLWERLGLLLG